MTPTLSANRQQEAAELASVTGAAHTGRFYFVRAAYEVLMPSLQFACGWQR
jgi:hypothetical protein